jgi:hypothetical protein
LAAYIRRQPSRELYRVEGPMAALLHAVQAGAVLYATSAAEQVGIGRILGNLLGDRRVSRGKPAGGSARRSATRRSVTKRQQ